MPSRYQQILQRLRLLVLCLSFALAFESPVGRFEAAEPAATLAGPAGNAARGGLTATRGAFRPSVSQPAELVSKSDAARSRKRGVERPLEAPPEAWSQGRPARPPSPLAGRAPLFDGRHLYLTYRVLLC